MRELVFEVEFLSDVVLPATSNTQGHIEHLEFIPGSNFLGMAAKEYESYEDSFALFHSGAVRFGDATLLYDGKPTYKLPLSIFKEKTDETKLINQLHTPLTTLKQAKQLRNGYITKDEELINIDYSYAQKSAYDKEHRRSKDSSMFGYKALERGTHWQFALKYDEGVNANDIERVKANLIGIKQLGKSKSAEYAQVNITLKGESQNIEELKHSQETILYAKSRIALVDEEGNPTYDLTYLCVGLSDTNIDYEKTQLKTSVFTPYNSTRKSTDYERFIINSGSVIVLKNITQEQLNAITSGVGAYLSEGFGEILINPSFLTKKECAIKEIEKKVDKEETPSQLTTQTALFLNKRKSQRDTQLSLANDVQEFINKTKDVYKEKFNSQWGTIRSLCANTADIHTDVEKYITTGAAKEKWKGEKAKHLLDAIQEHKNPVAFTKLLSMQMPKVKTKEAEENDEN